jgi:uncharacterized protein YdhG (YjbR/CyaY superfamily)
MNTNQDHSCGEAPKTIDAYISAQSESVRPLLNQVRDALRAALPGATELISWQMPTYRGDFNIIHFAAFKNHLGLYPGPGAIVHFADRLTEYKTSKGAIQFRYDKPIPLGLIAKIAIWCKETSSHP